MGEVGRVDTLISPATYSISNAKRRRPFLSTDTCDEEGILTTIGAVCAFLCFRIAMLNP
jgi:hypothetical protein